MATQWPVHTYQLKSDGSIDQDPHPHTSAGVEVSVSVLNWHPIHTHFLESDDNTNQDPYSRIHAEFESVVSVILAQQVVQTHKLWSHHSIDQGPDPDMASGF